jgi:hypothetical protein
MVQYEDVSDKIHQCRSDYNNRPSNVISFMSDILSTSGGSCSEFVSQFKSKVGNILDKSETLRITSRRLTSSLSSLSLGVPVRD